MSGLFKNEKFWLVLAGAAGAIIGGKILKSPKTRELVVNGLAKGMMLRDDAKAELTNMKEEAEDICYEARQKAKTDKSLCQSDEIKGEADDEV